MRLAETGLNGLIVLEPEVTRDKRGFFLESYNRRTLERLGISTEFVQDNNSRSKQNVLRGIHYQGSPEPAAKLVRCTLGSVYDVAVDLRLGSPTLGQWHAVELTAENMRQVFLPIGFGHAFLVLSDWAEVQYKSSAFYNPAAEGAIAWNDPDIGIDWPVTSPILSERDQDAPSLRDYLQRLQ